MAVASAVCPVGDEGIRPVFDDGRFELGPVLIQLGHASLAGTEIRELALPVLEKLTAAEPSWLSPVAWQELPLGASAIEQHGSAIPSTTVEALAQTMETPSADEMGAAIDASGRVALYGILFDSGKAEVKPEGMEILKRVISILKDVKDLVPPEVFTTEWKNPVYESDDKRKNWALATQLCAAFEQSPVSTVVYDDSDCPVPDFASRPRTMVPHGIAEPTSSAAASVSSGFSQ